MSLAPGNRVGPYEILGPLGQGGMGVVYRARDPRLNREIALKVLRPELRIEPDRKLRFLHEAQAASSLNHPNIVTVHDIGTEGETTYMIMELVDGQPLDELMPPEGMPVPEVLRIVIQVADACAKAHATGIVHRDLKPANVMLQKDGRVKVLDFGLAKLVEPGGGDAGRSVATKTAEGMIVGTAAYMSPEQAEGKPLDGRADIFSLGAMLYELCTGKRPFRGDSPASVLAKVLQQDPLPPGDLRADLPPELGRLVMRCLRKDPTRRVQSMADLKAALEDLKDGADSGTLSSGLPAGTPAIPVRAPAPTRWRRYFAVVAAAAALALALAAGVVWRQRINGSAPVDPPLQPVPLTSYPGVERPGGFSPDGNQVVFSWDGERQDNFDVYVKLIGPGPPLRLTTDPHFDGRPTWSPDGRHIAFIRRLERESFAVLLVPPLGGPERRLAQFHTRAVIDAMLASICWTPDSKFLLVTGGRGPGEPNNLQRVAIDTGEVTTLITVDRAAEGYTSLDLSPDGRTLATVRLDLAGRRRVELMTMTDSLERGGSRMLTSLDANVGDVRWTADSRDLVFSIFVNNPLPLYRIAVAAGDPTPLVWTGPGAEYPTITARGDRLVFARNSRDTNIWRVALDDTGTRALSIVQLASSSFREVFPQYSPDGTRLAFHSNRGGSVQVWTSDADGSRAAQVTSMDPLATTGSPRWSPNGTRISFDSNAGASSYHVYTMSADGGPPKALTSGASTNFVSAWSPDGRWIYFSSDRSGRLEVWRLPSEGGNAEQITRQGGQGPTLTANGRWLYYIKKDGAEGLWRMPPTGGKEHRLADAVYRYNFAPTDEGVYFMPPVKPGGTSSIRFRDFRTGTITEIVTLDKPGDLGLALSPDRRHLLFTKIDYQGTDLMLVENFR